MRLFGLCALFALTALAPAVIVIDTFADIQPTLTDDDSTAISSRQESAEAFGGSRGLQLFKQSGPAGSITSTRVQAGWFGASDFGTTGTATASYLSTSAVPASGSLIYSSLTNLNLSGMSEFRIHMLGNDFPVILRATMTDARFDPGLQLRTRVWQRTIAAGGARLETLTLANLTQNDPGFDVTQVDLLQFTVFGSTNADWGISRIEAVPEPGTMAALGLGAMAVAARRRRRK